LGITSVPAFIFYSNGEEVRRARGNLSREEIRLMFRSPDSLF
jgi:hypothetical protein